MHPDLTTQGYRLIPGVIDAADITKLCAEVSQLDSSLRGGTRNLLAKSALVNELAKDSPIKELADNLLAGAAFPVRALFFDKVPESNWKVPWHQDTTIAVRERNNVSGFSGWSEKEGIPHVHPPADVLAGMIALRLHLDDCGPGNGPLRVIPGTHTAGILTANQIETIRSQQSEIFCCAYAGDILAMRPLLLHASSPAKSPAHRRVIHIEYACQPLPGGLRWQEEAHTLAV